MSKEPRLGSANKSKEPRLGSAVCNRKGLPECAQEALKDFSPERNSSFTTSTEKLAHTTKERVWHDHSQQNAVTQAFVLVVIVVQKWLFPVFLPI